MLSYYNYENSLHLVNRFEMSINVCFSKLAVIQEENLTLFYYFLRTDVPSPYPQRLIKHEEIPEKVDFNYHVKPILSDRCYSCHGPDEKSRRAGLRLDQEKTAFMRLSSGRTAIDPGSISGSEMAHRILSDDPDEVMPTPESNLSLTTPKKQSS